MTDTRFVGPDCFGTPERMGLLETHGLTRHMGKFNHPMASYLYSLSLSGDEGDEAETDGATGDWASRYGRRLLFGNSQGFVTVQRCDGVEEAKEELNLWRNDHPGIYEDDYENYESERVSISEIFVPSESRLRPNMAGE